MGLYTHWACFDCRKSFHYLPATGQSSIKRKCPECREAICDMGIYFEPPPSRAKKAWAIMELIAVSGYRFQTEGSKAFIDSFILTTPKPTLRDVRHRIELLKKRNEEDKIKSRVKSHKEENKRRRGPKPPEQGIKL